MSQSVGRCHFSRFSAGFDFAAYNLELISAVNQRFCNNLVIFQVYNDIIMICFGIVYFDFFQLSNKVLRF